MDIDRIIASSLPKESSVAVDRHSGRDDLLLFSRFLAGEDEALVRLFDLHNHRLYRYCRQMLGDAARAEDITQEMWERIIRLRSEGKATAENPTGLLLIVARNLCLDYLRSRRDHLHLHEVAESSLLYEGERERTHLEELVTLAMSRVPMEQREVLTLHYYSGYPLTAIAAMLGESVGAVKNRAWRGRVHLARLITAMVGMDEEKGSSHGYTGEEPSWSR